MEVHYVIQTAKKKEVISNSGLYTLTKDGGEFSFVWEPSENLIAEMLSKRSDQHNRMDR